MPAMVETGSPRLCPGTMSLLHPRLESLPGHDFPKYSAYCNMEKVEQESSHDLGHEILVMGNTGATEVELSLSCLGCKPVCELLTSKIWASDHPPVSPSSPPTSQGGLSPSIGPQDCGLSCSPSKVGVYQCNVLFPLSPLSRAQILT